MEVEERERPLLIGELAARSGLAARTIRFYERAGLLPSPPRSPSGYRLYPPEATRHLAFVASAKALGLRLSEIRDLLALRSENGPPCAEARQLLEGRVREVEAQMERLTRLREALGEILSRWDDSYYGELDAEGLVCPRIEAAVRR